jgi:hypothetical protein
MAKEAEAMLESIENQATPTSSLPSAKEVERMLRSPKAERSPFA